MQINFGDGADRYVLYSRIVRTGFGPGGNNPQSETGVAVIRGNKIVSDHRCNDPWNEAILGDVDTLLPEGGFTMWELREH